MNWNFLTHVCIGLVGFIPVVAEAGPVLSDLAYVSGGHTQQRLDLHLPSGPGPHPLIIFVHGGAWRSGSKKEMPLAPLISDGFAIASVDYRLSTTARFPAQLEDLRAAIRFLRAGAETYHLDPRRLAIAGTSAGGHLAALAGLAHEDTSGAVQAIISLYGASNLTTILSQSTPQGLRMRVPALELLLGGQPDTRPELAKQASPVFHVDANAPPILLIHGEDDPQMPVAQARELAARYRELQRPVHLEIIPGAKHGGVVFFSPRQLALMKVFLAKSLGLTNDASR